MPYRYPCTGNISLKGFGEYLEQNIGHPRRNIQLFAKEFNEYQKSEYVTLVNSGSSANLVAALALAEKVKADGKSMTAITSAFTFPTTLSALLLAGFSVKLIDTEPDGFNMDLEALKKEECPSVVAITHFLGFPCRTSEIAEYVHARGAYLMQDACETFDLYNPTEGRRHWEYGDVTTFSFYHPHHLSSYGGGAVLCNNLSDHILCDSIAHWGRACKCHFNPTLCTAPEGAAHQFTYERLGVNVEISELNAAFGRWQLQNRPEIERRRKENYVMLYNALKDTSNLKVWPMPATTSGSPFVFPIRLKNGMSVKDAWRLLSAQGVEIRTLMGGASITHPAFKDKVCHDTQTNALVMSRDTFFVGIHHTLPQENVRAVADIINRTFR